MAVESSDGSLPVRFTLEEQKFKKTFRTLEEIEEFLQSEVSFWTAISVDLQQNGINKILGAQFQNFIIPAQQILSSFRQNKNASSAINALSTIEERHFILSAGQFGRLIAKYAAEKPMAVPGLVFAVHAKLNSRNHPRIPQSTNGTSFQDVASISSGIIALSEQNASAQKQRQFLDQLISDFQESLDNVEETKHAFTDWSTNQQSQSEDALETFKSNATECLDETRSSLSACLAESQARVLELEKQVRDRLILEAPTKYWKKKAQKHYVAAVVFGLIFIIGMGGGIYWLLAHGVELISNATTELVKAQPDSSLSLLVPLVFITLPSLAFAWVLRHISRVVVQNLSLAADAGLRGTIATTYSALTHEKDATDAQLALALQALFRPIDGNSHAEIAPPNIQDVLELARKN